MKVVKFGRAYAGLRMGDEFKYLHQRHRVSGNDVKHSELVAFPVNAAGHKCGPPVLFQYQGAGPMLRVSWVEPTSGEVRSVLSTAAGLEARLEDLGASIAEAKAEAAAIRTMLLSGGIEVEKIDTDPPAFLRRQAD